MTEQPKGTPAPAEQDTAEPTLAVGVDPANERVVLVLEITGERAFRVQFRYTQQEAAALAMTLVTVAKSLEPEKPRIVLPKHAAKSMKPLRVPRK